MAARHLLVCAAEISGDARGARLAREILQIAPDWHLWGLGGRRMGAAGVDVRLDITDRGTVGWFDHWRDLPCYVSALRFWRSQIRDRRPDAVIVIDAPGISFPFARLARAAGVRVVYFVTPQTWLWNPKGAIERLRRHADLVIPTLPAEADIYARAGLPVIYEGHPALDDLSETYRDRPSDPRTVGPSGPVTIALVPGSRRHAIRRLLPIMLDALALVRQRVPIANATISVAERALHAEVDACLRDRPDGVRIVEADLGSALKASDVAMASTGGNLLDAAFAGVPAVPCYRVDRLTYLGAKYLLRLDSRIPDYALPNLLAGTPVLSALIQDHLSPGRLAEATLALATDERARDRVLAGYERVRAAMGQPGVNARLAERIIRLVDPGFPGQPLDFRSGLPEHRRREPLPRP